MVVRICTLTNVMAAWSGDLARLRSTGQGLEESGGTRPWPLGCRSVRRTVGVSVWVDTGVGRSNSIVWTDPQNLNQNQRTGPTPATNDLVGDSQFIACEQCVVQLVSSSCACVTVPRCLLTSVRLRCWLTFWRFSGGSCHPGGQLPPGRTPRLRRLQIGSRATAIK